MVPPENGLRGRIMKFLCTCQHVVRDQECPNPIGYYLISDVNFDEVAEPIDFDVFWRISSRVLRCENCGRLWIYWKGGENNPQEFVPAEPAK